MAPPNPAVERRRPGRPRRGGQKQEQDEVEPLATDANTVMPSQPLAPLPASILNTIHDQNGDNPVANNPEDNANVGDKIDATSSQKENKAQDQSVLPRVLRRSTRDKVPTLRAVAKPVRKRKATEAAINEEDEAATAENQLSVDTVTSVRPTSSTSSLPPAKRQRASSSDAEPPPAATTSPKTKIVLKLGQQAQKPKGSSRGHLTNNSFSPLNAGPPPPVSPTMSKSPPATAPAASAPLAQPPVKGITKRRAPSKRENESDPSKRTKLTTDQATSEPVNKGGRSKATKAPKTTARKPRAKATGKKAKQAQANDVVQGADIAAITQDVKSETADNETQQPGRSVQANEPKLTTKSKPTIVKNKSGREKTRGPGYAVVPAVGQTLPTVSSLGVDDEASRNDEAEERRPGPLKLSETSAPETLMRITDHQQPTSFTRGPNLEDGNETGDAANAGLVVDAKAIQLTGMLPRRRPARVLVTHSEVASNQELRDEAGIIAKEQMALAKERVEKNMAARQRLTRMQTTRNPEDREAATTNEQKEALAEMLLREKFLQQKPSKVAADQQKVRQYLSNEVTKMMHPEHVRLCERVLYKDLARDEGEDGEVNDPSAAAMLSVLTYIRELESQSEDHKQARLRVEAKGREDEAKNALLVDMLRAQVRAHPGDFSVEQTAMLLAKDQEQTVTKEHKIDGIVDVHRQTREFQGKILKPVNDKYKISKSQAAKPRKNSLRRFPEVTEASSQGNDMVITEFSRRQLPAISPLQSEDLADMAREIGAARRASASPVHHRNSSPVRRRRGSQ